MKYGEVVEGMKVVPHSKYGEGIRPGVSVVWERAQKMEPQVKKPCIIRNEQFTWVLYVDGEAISFQGGLAANYFERHYKSLGYEVTVDRDYYKRNEE